MIKFLSLFVGVIVSLAYNSVSDRIVIKLKKGQSFTQHKSIKMAAPQNVMGKEIPTLNIFDVVHKFEVINVIDSIYSLKVTYKSMSGRLILNGDSSSAGKNQISQAFDALKGKSYVVNMSNTGRVIATFGADLILKDIVAKMTDVPEEVKKTILSQLLETYGDKGIKLNAELGMYLYPPKLVREGDSWNVNRKGGDNLAEPKIDAVYKLDKITESVYLISGKSNLVINSGNKMTEMSGTRYNLSGTWNSSGKIDKKTGMVIEIKIDQDLKGNITMNGKAKTKDAKLPTYLKGVIIITNTINK